jgi:VanZ family protein
VGTIRRLIPAIAVFASILCLAAIFAFSTQDYSRQDVRPLLKRLVPRQQMERLVPDVRFRYGDRYLDGRRDPYSFAEFVLRKAAHLLLYGCLGAGSCLALRAAGRPGLRAGMTAVLIAVLIGMFDEWNQSGQWRRYGSAADVVLDAVGAAVGAAIALAAVRRLGTGGNTDTKFGRDHPSDRGEGKR